MKLITIGISSIISIKGALGNFVCGSACLRRVRFSLSMPPCLLPSSLGCPEHGLHMNESTFSLTFFLISLFVFYEICVNQVVNILDQEFLAARSQQLQDR